MTVDNQRLLINLHQINLAWQHNNYKYYYFILQLFIIVYQISYQPEIYYISFGVYTTIVRVCVNTLSNGIIYFVYSARFEQLYYIHILHQSMYVQVVYKLSVVIQNNRYLWKKVSFKKNIKISKYTYGLWIAYS